MTARRTRLAALAGATALGATLLTASPAAAVDTRSQCREGQLGARTCVGIQTDGGDVRGWASITDPAGGADLVVTTRSVTLQRRACGGSWQTWTSRSTTGDGSTSGDTDVTTWVVFPRGYQFRTVATYSSSYATPPYTGASDTYTSQAYGGC